ncbi:hypothetical protein EVAR_36667_1 [Eumeta japonica]|uniref:Uncharacterized protein n=1 Tax=Eumeta variegata TaxID=151549 RepID=A0A4C1XYZ6_EUMVA|nr:hypothetical protein EVAR_36667_1 [Eumeta japonica]
MRGEELIEIPDTACAQPHAPPALRRPPGPARQRRPIAPEMLINLIPCRQGKRFKRAGIAQLLPGDGRIGLKLTSFCRLNRHETRHFQCRRYEKVIFKSDDLESL